MNWTKELLTAYANKYFALNAANHASVEQNIEDNRAKITAKGFLTLAELEAIAYWKSPRTKPLILKNDDAYVQLVTQQSLSSTNDLFALEVLTLLHGVSVPMASVILHFYHKKEYPIVDFRALDSLGITNNENYDAKFWTTYLNQCRTMAKEFNVDMRTLDKALWAKSKERIK